MLGFRGYLAALAVAAAATGAAAAPAGDSAWAFHKPALLGDSRVHGAVCRTSTVGATSLGGVRLERVGEDGRVVSYDIARLSRELGGRQSGCAFYDQPTGWTLAGGERIRVCAAGDKACRAD